MGASGRCSLPLPQVDVDDAADQGEGEGYPGQGEAVAEAASAGMLGQDLLGVNGVDQGPSEHCHTCGKRGRRVVPADDASHLPGNG